MAELAPSTEASAPVAESSGANLERKARKEAQKALKAKQAAQKKEAAKAAASAPSPSPSSSKSKQRGRDAEEQLSRALAYILRHGAEKEGLHIRADGYIKLEEVLQRPRVKSVQMDGRRAGLEDVQKIVEGNDKKRFELKEEEDEWWIRAVQGHSLKHVIELEHTQLTLNNLHLLSSASDADDELANALDSKLNLEGAREGKVEVIHGTNPAAWEEILSSGGLKPMTRNHIHLAKGKFGEKGVISGMRKSASRLIYVDIRKAIEGGIEFVLSSNGVVLTEGKGGVLGKEYFTRVEDQRGNVVWTAEQ